MKFNTSERGHLVRQLKDGWQDQGTRGQDVRAPLAIALILLALTSPRVHADEPSIRAEFLRIISPPRVALEPRVEPLAATNGFEQFHFSYAADSAQRVPGILIKPRGGARRPVVIAMHGTGGNKEQNRALLLRLAGKGFIAIAIDGRYHGERTRKGSGDADYNEAILRAFQTTNEHPFFYDTAWDIMRLVDYLETRDDVDAKRIGLIGFSKGGIETYLAAAADPRIAVAVPCIGVQSFGWALTNEMWQFRIETIQRAFTNAAANAKVTKPDQGFVRNFYDRVAPGIYDRFDGPAMLALIAPRPLLAINGDSDRRTPIPGLELCAAAARDAYERAGAKEKFVLRIQENTGHKVTDASLKEAIDWFVRWLKP